MFRLTAEKRNKLKRVAVRPDREIDFSEIPEIQEFPSDAVIGKFYRLKKASVTIRIDADVLAWLKSSGRAGGFSDSPAKPGRIFDSARGAGF